MKRDQSSGSCRFIPRSERMKVDLIGKGAEATWMFLFEAECNHQDQHLKWVDVGIDAVNDSLREMNSSPRRR